MTIRVISLDYDGCLSREGASKENYDWVTAQHETFLAQIKQEMITSTRTVVLVGSNRQSFQSDEQNQRQKKYVSGSCFPAIQRVSEHLGASLDKFLLADVYNDSPSGTAFKAALNSQKLPHDWTFDRTKVTVLYAQMHRLALQYPNEDIVFDFYDDYEPLIVNLNEFFKEHSDFVPRNLLLKLHHYEGGERVEKFCIQGTGVIDVCYRESVKKLAQLAIEKTQNEMGGEITGWKDIDFPQFSSDREVRIKKAKYFSLKAGLFGGALVSAGGIAAHFLAACQFKLIVSAVLLSGVNPFFAIAIVAAVTAILVGLAVKKVADWKQNRLERS